MHTEARDLEAGLVRIQSSPQDHGTIELIVRRPDTETREVVEVAELDTIAGLVGDNWKTRGSSKTVDGSAHPEKQLTLMNARAIAVLAGARDNWAIAGDQLYVDLDLGRDNLPAGTQLVVGTAIVVVTEPPHIGCKKFSERFGSEAMRWVNSPVGRSLNLRGINTKIVRSGVVRCGDSIRRV